MQKKVLFYNDLGFFGGHEIMTAKIANVLVASSDYRVGFIFYHPYFSGILDERVQKIKIPFKTKVPLPGIRSFNLAHIRHIVRIIKDTTPSLFVVSQGNIEFGLKGMFAAQAIKARTTSYLPCGYSFSETKSFFHAIRDRINSVYYRIPDAYITLNEYQKKLLERFITKRQRIYTVRNPIEGVVDDIKRTGFKAVKGGAFNIGIIGTINFRHKNQHILIKVSQLLRKEKFNFKFYIIGEGPDKIKLVRLIARNNLREHFVLTGWLNETSKRQLLLQYIDVVLIVSLLEGMPLVLLEALAMNIPFLISDLDSIKEYNFPAIFLINPYDPQDIKNKIIAMYEDFNNQEYSTVRNDMLKRHHIEKFRSDVMETFNDLTG